MARVFLVAFFVLIAIFALLCSAQVVEMVSESDGVAEVEESPYFHAARVGNMDTIDTELELGHDVNVRNADGWTPLLFAVDAYQPHVIVQLIRAGADINVQDNDGWSPLMFAAHSGNTILVGLLLENHADPLLANKEGFGAHSIAQFEGYPSIAKHIATEGVKVAMETEDFDAMLLMIRDGASVNTRNVAGWTPLIAAISAGAEGVVRELLTFPDIDLNLAENDGWTPLMFAANNNRLQSAQWLVERGADTLVKSRMGFSAGGIARDRNFADLAALIKKAPAVRNRFLAEQQQQQASAEPVLLEVADTQQQRQQLQQQSAADYKTGPAGPVGVAAGASASGGGTGNKKTVEPAPVKKSGWLW